jgi:iron-sulfur cluster assembly accessory protein
MFKITEKAILKIKEIAEDEGIEHTSVRLKIFGSGCAGFRMDLSFDNTKTDNDEVIETEGVQILIDEVCFQYFQETTLDYESGLMGSGFKFQVANSSGSCGCGRSIAF